MKLEALPEISSWSLIEGPEELERVSGRIIL